MKYPRPLLAQTRHRKCNYPIAPISIPRRKPRSIFISVIYRLVRISRVIFGDDLLLRLCLNGSWILQRSAFEICGERFGESFHHSNMGLTQELLKEFLPPAPTILDIGCGTGRWCRLLAEYAESVIGVDNDPALIEIARQRTTSSNVMYLLGDAQSRLTQLLSGRRFDAALLVHVLEHLDDIHFLLSTLRDVTNTIIVEVPDFDSDKLNKVRLDLGCPFYSDADHVREYTLDSLLDQLHRSQWPVLYYERHRGVLLAIASCSESTHRAATIADFESCI